MELEDLSIKARVALAALCLENLLEAFVPNYQSHQGWQLIMKSIWDYTEKAPGEWHYRMAEITPFSVEEEVPFEEKGIETVDKEVYLLIIDAYKSTNNTDVKKVIDLIFEIGTLDLYASIQGKSPRTLYMLQQILEITSNNGLNVPSLSRFTKFSISVNEGWGDSFYKSDVS